MKENQNDLSNPISISIEETEYSIVPGNITKILLKIQNQGENLDYFEIGIRGVPLTWVTLHEQVIQLAPGEERQITLTVQPPPPPQTQAGIYPMKVVVISQADHRQTAQVEITLRVSVFESRGRIGVMMETVQFSTAPGSSIDVPILLLNQGLEADSFRMSLEGLPVNWISTQNAITRLEPGDKKKIVLIIRPPRVSSSKAGRHSFKIKFTSQLVPDDFVEVNCILTIAAFSEYRVGLQPDQAQAGTQIQLMVDNQSNIDQSFELTWQSQKGELQFEAILPLMEEEKTQQGIKPEHQVVPLSEPYSLRVAAGMVESIQFLGKPTKQQIFGGEKIHNYTVTVQPSDKSEEKTLKVQGRMTDRAWAPAWVLPALAVILVGFACLFIFLTAQARTQRANATETASYGTALAIAATQTSSADQTTATVVDGLLPTEVMTALPPTGEPPTQAPPAEIPPTEVPTALPPTAEPPTQAPPTDVPPTEVPPTEVPPTEVPPTEVPPTEVPPQQTPALPNLPGSIAFVSDRDGNPEIYLQNGTDHNVTRLTNNPAVDTQPAWSPDGSRIAFTTNRDGNNEIYLMNADGSDPVNLSNNSSNDQDPNWSPDGRWIVFSSNRDGNWEIYVAAVDGSTLANLTNNPADDQQPIWFRSSGLLSGQEKIAFVTNRDGNFEIYSMNSDGSDLVNLTNNPANDTSPAASHGGRTIAFVSDRNGSRDIFLMGSNGDSPVNRTNNPADDLHPSWSPDDKWIAFSTNRGNREIYVMKPDGTNVTNFTNNPAADEFPSWR